MDLTKIIPETYDGCFIMPNGSYEKYDNFRVLLHSIDTIRQFYECRLKMNFINDLEHTAFPRDFEISGTTYTLSKLGKASGFQYSLQSKKLGLQILFKSFYKKAHLDGNHIKLELSPHFLCLDHDIQHNHIETVLSTLTHFAHPVHFAIHFAIDFQVGENYEFVDQLFPNFYNRIKGFRANGAFQHDKMEWQFNNKDFSFTVNGRKGAESITLGASNAFQFSIYRKDLEIVKTDKVEFFKDLWGDKYDDQLPVFRLELRIHQRQIVSYDVPERYYLDYIKASDFSLFHTFITERIRYMDETKSVLSPIWFLLVQSLYDKRSVTRTKPKKDAAKTLPNSTLALGNMVALYLKLDASVEQIVDELLQIKIIKISLMDKYNILFDHPERDFLIKEKLSEYVSKKHAEFQLEHN